MNIPSGIAGCVLALTLTATTAHAQFSGSQLQNGRFPSAGSNNSDDDSGPGGRPHKHDQPAGQPGKKTPLPEVKAAPEPWPRLDPGAVFCRTAEDLRQHFAAVAARLDGTGGVGEPSGCRLIRSQTAVAVLTREGPARTQVRLTAAPAETGWTDAFLPEKKTGP